jgi:hypothetical protein
VPLLQLSCNSAIFPLNESPFSPRTQIGFNLAYPFFPVFAFLTGDGSRVETILKRSKSILVVVPNPNYSNKNG